MITAERGSLSLTLTDGFDEINAFSGGACDACTISAAAPLFSIARKLLAGNDGTHAQSLRSLGAAVAHPDAHTAPFAYAVAGAGQVDGIALHPASDKVQFLELRTLMSKADRGLVPWILASVHQTP